MVDGKLECFAPDRSKPGNMSVNIGDMHMAHEGAHGGGGGEGGSDGTGIHGSDCEDDDVHFHGILCEVRAQ